MSKYFPKSQQQKYAVALYLIFLVVAVLWTKVFLILLALLHFCEYLFVSRNMASEKNIPQPEALLQTLLYGFTWWKPIKDGK